MNKDIKEKSYINDFRRLFSYKDYRLTKSIENDNSIDFIFVRRKSSAECPLCGNRSRKKHSTQSRHILDLPILGKQVHLIFSCDKYYCVNPSCKRKIFVTPIDGFRARARRTLRLDEQIREISREMSFNGASRTLKNLNINCSSSTCGRIFKSTSISSPPSSPTHIGIDDFAYKKGQVYGTVIVDLNTGQPLDLLDSRESSAITDWLKNHKSVKYISRDGGLNFKRGIESSKAEVSQIRDRFHLMTDFSKYIENMVKRLASNLRLRVSDVTYNPDIVRVELWRHIFSFCRKDIQRKYERYIIYNEMAVKGYSIKDIAERLKMNVVNVRRHRNMQLKNNVPPIGRSFYTHMEEIAKAISDKRIVCESDVCRLFSDINQEILTGFDERLENIRRECCKDKYVKIKIGAFYSKEIFRTFFEEGYQTKNDAINALMNEYDYIKNIIELCLDFRKMMNGNKSGILLKEWLQKAKSYRIKELTSFARMISLDMDAVENAINLPWNNGIMEGTVNKIKTLKRMMYGRASFSLLKLKLLAYLST